jgi:hypothetical protein
VEAAKAAPSPFKMGGTGSKREDHVLTVFMEKRTGAKFSYLPYKSGGEAATQLVGEHSEANVNNPSENLEVWRAGQVRALCVFDKERIAYKGKDITRLAPADVARLGMVRSFQISAVFPHFTVLENVRIALQRARGGSFDFWRSARVLDQFNQRALALVINRDVGKVLLGGFGGLQQRFVLGFRQHDHFLASRRLDDLRCIHVACLIVAGR